MTYVDVHCHLDFKDFREDREKLLQEMKEKNIFALSNTLNRQNYEETKKIFEEHKEQVRVCPGLYPDDARDISEEEFQSYLGFLKEHKKDFIAIGEIGLDAYHTTDEELLKLQEKRFRAMLDLAVELQKPVLIHTRKKEERVLEILREYKEQGKKLKADLHCFMGKKKYLKEIKELGVYCSVPLLILNTESFKILVQELPIKQLLVETDSPYLNPSKERNSPLNVPLIYEEIARIKGYDSKEIQSILYRNYQQFIM